MTLTTNLKNAAWPLWSQPNRQAAVGAAGQPSPPAPESVYRIERLDDSLLRLRLAPPPRETLPTSRPVPGRPSVDRGTTFYSRIQTDRLNAQPLTDLPQEARRLAQLAQLTPDEVKGLAQFMKSDTAMIAPKLLKALDQTIAARYHEIGFAELFGLSEEEAAAYRELMKLTDGDYDAAVRYADDAGTLSPAEKNAIKKLMTFRYDFLNNSGWISSISFKTSDGIDLQLAGEVQKTLMTRLSNLRRWLDATMYQNGSHPVRGQASDGNPPAGAVPAATNEP